ncbi:hypothetical protein F4804DRAFT_329250 [Jackrogersella minutella]|nr:hypothetical protein F4804DRAFT_329250 [Jackrogersella minutella]
MSFNPLICYSLRKRPDWAPVAPAVLQSKNPRWKGTTNTVVRYFLIFYGIILSAVVETKLDTHDAALPLPGSSGQFQRVLRVIFLSTSDVSTEECRSRVQRLSHMNGGQDTAIVFLLKQEKDQADPISAFMTLQLDLGEFEMPVIPVNSVQDVPASLMAFHRQISISNAPRKMASPAQTLLPYCSDRPCLPEHAVNVLTDITYGVRDLLDTMSTPAGQTKIFEFLGSDSESAISFWVKEYLVE